MPDAATRLLVTQFECAADYGRVLDYFLSADEPFLRGMGVDPGKLPGRDAWLARLLPDLTRPDPHKQTFYLGWDQDGKRIGHCNLNPLVYGDHAHVHLHLWDAGARRAGLGTEFLRRSLEVFFRRFALQRLYCEPYAENPAPNRLLTKAGFLLEKRYRTTPGLINTEQDVNRYVMHRRDHVPAGAALQDAGPTSRTAPRSAAT
jgi:RimJ/RimL family protein N-acetyltransferase